MAQETTTTDEGGPTFTPVSQAHPTTTRQSTSFLPFQIDESRLVEVPVEYARIDERNGDIGHSSSAQQEANQQTTSQANNNNIIASSSSSLIRFPPGCPVLFCDPHNFTVSLGVVSKVYVHPFDVLKNLCRILLFQPIPASSCSTTSLRTTLGDGTNNNNANSNYTHTLYVVEHMLQFGPECPVWINDPRRESGMILESYHSFRDHSKPAKYSVMNEKRSAVRHGISVENIRFRPTHETHHAFQRLELLLSSNRQQQQQQQDDRPSLPLPPPPPQNGNRTMTNVNHIDDSTTNENSASRLHMNQSEGNVQTRQERRSLAGSKRSRTAINIEGRKLTAPNTTLLLSKEQQDRNESGEALPTKRINKAGPVQSVEVKHTYILPSWISDAIRDEMVDGLTAQKQRLEQEYCCSLSWVAGCQSITTTKATKEEGNEAISPLKVDILARSKRSSKRSILIVEVFLISFLPDQALRGRLHWELTSERQLKGSSATRTTPLRGKSILDVEKTVDFMVIRIGTNQNGTIVVDSKEAGEETIPSLLLGKPDAAVLLAEIEDIRRTSVSQDHLDFMICSRGIGDGHGLPTIYLEASNLSIIKSAQMQLERCIVKLGLKCL